MSEQSVPPTRYTAGTTYVYRRVLAEYPAGEWTMTLLWRGPPDSLLDLVGIADGTDHVFTLTATLGAALAPATYRWFEWLTRGEGAALERYLYASGEVVVDPNPETALAGELADPLEQELAALNAELARRYAGGDIESYQVGGGDTLITRRQTKELEQRRDWLQAQKNARERGGAFQTVRARPSRTATAPEMVASQRVPSRAQWVMNGIVTSSGVPSASR